MTCFGVVCNAAILIPPPSVSDGWIAPLVSSLRHEVHKTPHGTHDTSSYNFPHE